jgi:hypothetical protein
MRRFFGKLSNALKLPNTARDALRGARRAHLRVEALEERQMLTVSPASGIGLLTGIAAEYAATAGEWDAYHNNVQQLLGAATSGVISISVPGVWGAQMQTYQHGTIYYSDKTGGAVVYGDVAVKYRSLGGPAAFGLPTSDEAGVPASPGVRFTNFDNGHSIIWSAATGSHAVYSAAIMAEYTATANEKNALGTVVQKYLGPLAADETYAPGVKGARMATFQNGTIYWSGSSTDSAHVLYGGIAAKYASLGASGTTTTAWSGGGSGAYVPIQFYTPGFGLPVSDEADVPGMPGMRVTNFDGGRSIYWLGGTNGPGAHVVSGLIRDEYQLTAGQTDAFGNAVQWVLGAPTSDDKAVPGVPGAVMNTFQGGTIYWSKDTLGAHAVYGAIGANYASMAGPSSFLGLPISEQQQDDNGVREQYFQYGKMLSLPQGTLAIPATQSMSFDTGYIGFASGIPVGGGVQVTVSQNGSYAITGSFRNHGYLPQEVKGVVALISPSGRVWTHDFSTNMSGLIGAGSRTGSIDIHDTDSALANNWADFQGGIVQTTTGVGVDWGWIGDQVKDIAGKAATGFLIAIAGALGGKAVDSQFPKKTNTSTTTGNTADNTVGGDDLGGAVAGPPQPDPRTGLYPTAIAVHPGGIFGSNPPLVSTSFAVTLDASAVGVPTVSLDGAPFDASAPFVANLLPGAHSLTTNGTDVTSFTVNSDGTISYDPTLEGALTGSGTTALTVHGYTVALDATALGVSALALDGMPIDGTAATSANLLPGQHTLTTNGKDVTTFTVNANGTVAYDATLEGSLTGNGTTALAVIGRAVALDASALGVASVSLDGVAHAATAQFSVNLLPGQHTLTTNGTDVTSFTVNADGTISYDPLLQGALTGSGTTSLVVNGRAVTLDASVVGVPSVSVDGVAYAATAPFSVILLPGQHSLNDGTNVISFTVNPDGTVTYDPALQGALTGSGTTSLVLQTP